MSRLAPLLVLACPLLIPALAAPRAQQGLPDLRIDPPDLDWRPADTDPPRRVALVVGADRAEDPRLGLPEAGAAAERLARVLRDLRYEVHTLTGRAVRGEGVRSKLAELTDGMGSPGNHLVVAWVGHGWVRSGGHELATAESDWVDGQGGAGRPVGTLRYDDLLAWVADEEREVREAGGELATCMLIDACRIGTMGGLGDASLTWDEDEADLQLFSAGPGKEAFVDASRGLPRFTSELCDVLEGLYRPGGGQVGRQPVDLRAAFERALEGSRELRLQEPCWIGRRDLERFLLYDPAYLSLTVRAVDAGTGAPLPDAVLTLQELTKGGPVATFDGIVPSREGYFLDARAPGYFGRSQIVELERVQSGLALDVPLLPAFSLVEGTLSVEDGPGAVVAVSLEGLPQPAEPFLVTGRGPYRLRAPSGVESCELVVRSGARELHREPLELGSLTAPRRVGDVDVPVFVRDPLRLRLEGAVEVGAGAVERLVGPISVRFDFDSLQDSDFKTGWLLYERIRRMAGRDQFESALAVLDQIGSDENLFPAARSRFAELRRELELACLLEDATDLQGEARLLRGAGQDRESRETMDRAIDLLSTEVATRKEDVRELLTSWLLVSAENWHGLGEFPRSLEQLDRLAALEYDRASLDGQRARIAEDWLREGFSAALEDGDWALPRETLRRVAALDGDGIDVGAWAERIEREAISPTCRAAFERGKQAQSRGERRLAIEAYVDALDDPGLNEHYRRTILPLVDQVEVELFRQYERVGFEKERDDPAGAVLAYLEVLHVDPNLSFVVETLLAEHPELDQREALREPLARFRQLAPWRELALDVRRAMASDRHVEAMRKLLAPSGAVHGPTRVLLQARILGSADAAQRRECERLLAEHARTFEALRQLEETFAERVASSSWDAAAAILERMAENPTADRLRLERMQAELEEQRAAWQVASAEAALDGVEDLMRQGRLREARKALAQARSLPGSPWRRGKSIDSDLDWLEEQSRPAALFDHALYATLGAEDMQLVVDQALAYWGPELEDFAFQRSELQSGGAGSPHWITIWLHEPTGLEFVLLPGGEVTLGSPEDEGGRDEDEVLHQVRLDPFLIARHEVTQRAWAATAGAAGLRTRPSHFSSDDLLPVESVSWEAASAWCAAAGLVLPSEAQWEHACRAGTRGRYAFGDVLARNAARHGGAWEDGPRPVGSYRANSYGLFDTHGNVWEWCRDAYLPYNRGTEPGSGKRVGLSQFRIARGGGYDDAGSARSAFRAREAPDYADRSVGFRPALDLPR